MTVGNMYVVAGNGSEYGFADCFGAYTGDAVPASRAEFACPEGLAVDAAGNLVTADTGSFRVRVVAARTGNFYGQAMTGGDVYTVAGDGSDGDPFTGKNALAVGMMPSAVAVDKSGNLIVINGSYATVWVVAESTGTFYGQPMMAGDIYHLANLQSGWNSGLALDANGNIVVSKGAAVGVIAVSSGTFYGQAMTAGTLYTIAGNGTPGFSGDGGPATAAELDGPPGLSLDSHGNVLIADSSNYRVRVVAVTSGTFYGRHMTAGDIYTIAGNGTCGAAGNGEPATQAETCPVAIAADHSGNVLITDYGRVQVLAAKTGTFYNFAMTAGHLYSVAGNGHAGFAGDGKALAKARFSGRFSLLVTPKGGVIIADGPRLREITS